MTRRPLLLLVVVGPSDNEDRNDDDEEESSIADMAPMIQIDPAYVLMSWISFASIATIMELSSSASFFGSIR